MLTDIENRLLAGVNLAVPIVGFGPCNTFLNSIWTVPTTYRLKPEEIEDVLDGAFGIVVVYETKIPFEECYRILRDYGRVLLKTKTNYNEVPMFDIIFKESDGEYYYYNLKKKPKEKPWWKR